MPTFGSILLGLIVIAPLAAGGLPKVAALPNDATHHDRLCIARELPALPDDIEGKRLYVHGYLDADPLLLMDPNADAAARHARALQMLRDAGAVLIETIDDRADVLIIGAPPMALPEPIAHDELDPQRIARNIAARRRYETWEAQADHLAKRAETLGVQRVVIGDWLVTRTYPDFDPIDRRVRVALASPIAANFADHSFSRVVDYLRRTTGIDFVVDWPVLKDADVARDTSITLSLGYAPAGEVLRKVLDLTPAKDLTYAPDDQGIVFVSHPDRLAQWTAIHPLLRIDGRDWTDAQRQAAAALRQPMPAHYEANTLNAVVPHICQAVEVQHAIDWAALNRAGIERDSLVFLMLQPTARGRLLELVLRLAGYTADPFSIDPQGVVHIPAQR